MQKTNLDPATIFLYTKSINLKFLFFFLKKFKKLNGRDEKEVSFLMSFSILAKFKDVRPCAIMDIAKGSL